MLPITYEPGTRIGAYTVVDEIARGGQGVVLKVRAADGSLAALKLLNEGDERDVRRFLQEGRVLAKLSHPNLPKVYDAGTVGVTPYLCMEYVEGFDLERFLSRSGVPPLDWTVELLATVAETVQFLHEHGVVHRDLKPLNVILEAGTQRPVLVDFGMAKRDTRKLTLESLDGLSLSRTGEIYGTPAFMAPEQINGEANESVDVYGLGATLYTLLTGTPPFSGTSALNVLSRVHSKAAADPRRANPTVPAAVAQFCLSSLEKDPALRPASAQAFAVGLRTCSLRREPRRRVGVALALVVALAACLTWAWTQGAAAGDPSSPAADTEREAAALLAQAAPAVSEDPERAVALCTEALRLTSSAEAYRLRGKSHMAQGAWAKALEDFTQAIKLGDDDPELLLDRAIVLRDLGDLARAEADSTRVIERQPDFVVAYVFRAALREDLGDQLGALADCNAAIEADPRCHAAVHNRAGLLAKLGRYEEALLGYDESLTLKPNVALSHAARGQAHAVLNNLSSALEDLSTAIELDPENLAFYDARGRVHAQNSDLAAAARDFEHVIERDPSVASAYVGRGAVRAQTGNFTGAQSDFSEAIRLRPSAYEVYFNRALLSQRLGRGPEQLADLERFLELAPPGTENVEQAKTVVEDLRRHLRLR